MVNTDLLARMKQELELLYEINVPVDIADFVVTDPATAAALADDDSISSRENLFVANDEDGAAITLFIDEQIVDELHSDDPLEDLHDGNLSSFCVALEGVSHFTYLAWRVHHDRQVSQLELEMQAEVDKFATVAMLLGRQGHRQIPRALGERLFERVRYRSDLDADARERYVAANAYAQRYCEGLERRSLRRQDGSSATRDLRRFYRLNQEQKIRHIGALN